MEDRKEIILKHSIPVEKDGGGTVEVNKLHLGRFKLKHLKLLPENFVEKGGNIPPADLIPIIAGMTGISEMSAGEIDIDDVELLAEGLMSFLAGSPVIGKK